MILLNDLILSYEQDRNQHPDSPDALLDYCQQKYIYGEIEVGNYRKIYQYLHSQGATSSHEIT
ncbi:YppF family protein [Aquibacillus sp. 3ASR75-11]|uniref:YppF family protein n=1 Tax=Terrihalobacillus insolitus TaxID=2950438 RepID=A0A9X3WY87_9BACI|nr:YppF family protein [Terrihalobacillus insolitus]MDC3413720.1 YppF family protein [Terrihalobacillus insolitus]MDC3425579.1 YppF family protein [Terrihalobacillus insolitus]